MRWYKIGEYVPKKYGQALVWAEGWSQPYSACYCTAPTTDGRGNDVSEHTGWLLSNVGAFYEDFGYFSDQDLLYYGIDSVKYIIPFKEIETPIED